MIHMNLLCGRGGFPKEMWCAVFRREGVDAEQVETMVFCIFHVTDKKIETQRRVGTNP